MAKKEIIRRKPKKREDPILRQKVIWKTGHICTFVFGLIFTGCCFYDTYIKYKQFSWRGFIPFFHKHTHMYEVESLKWIPWLITLVPHISYRLALIGVLLSHGVTCVQAWSHLNPTYYDLLSSNNFQNILIAALWLITRGSFYKLVPFFITSYLHLKAKDDSKATDVSLITKQNAALLHFLAYSEIFVLVSLAIDTVLLRGASGFAFMVYMTLYWIKLNFSPYVQTTVLRILSIFDRLVPASKKDKWDSARRFLLKKLEEKQRSKDEVRKRL